MAKHKKFTVQGKEILLIQQQAGDYISLNDIASNFPGEASDHIKNWLRSGQTIEFLGVWEKMHNENFNWVNFTQLAQEHLGNAFVMTTKRWVEETNAIGLEAKPGRYGGTYAHSDIALSFCYWLSPVFQLYFIKEFQRLKELEAEQREDQFRFDVRRELTKINWHRHREAVKLLQPRKLDTMGERYIFANEADLLNLALFGVSAKKWREDNPDKKGNIRDYASIEQLTVLANLENINALLIEHGFTQDERLQLLNEEAIKQMESLLQYDRATHLKELGEQGEL